MRSTASTLVRSRTAWCALASAVVTVFGAKFGLDTTQVAALVGPLQVLIGTFYVQDKRNSKR